MGLSNDPEKRARQLANLEKGGQAAAQRHSLPADHGAQGDPATPNTPGPETAGGRGELPVIDYNDVPPQQPTLPANMPAQEARPVEDHQEEQVEHQPDEPEDDEDLERYAHRDERGGLGGLIDGFLGR